MAFRVYFASACVGGRISCGNIAGGWGRELAVADFEIATETTAGSAVLRTAVVKLYQ